MVWEITVILRGGRDQERLRDRKRIPKTVPEVVGPNDLSKFGQGGANLTRRSSQMDR
jgi:hypothetical protein